MDAIDQIPWIGGAVAELFLCTVMVRRGQALRFPCFFGAIVFDFIRVWILASVIFFHLGSNTYFYVYWSLIPVEYVLSFAVTYEVFRHIFKPDVEFSSNAILRFTGLNVLVAIFAVALVIRNPSIFSGTLSPLLLVLDRSAEILRAGMLLLLAGFAAKLRLSWRHYVFAIAAGLGVYSAAGLITAAADVATNRMCSSWLTPIPHFAYLFATILWAAAFLRKEPVHDPLSPEQLEFVQDVLRLARTAEHEIRRALHNDDR